MSSTSQDSLSPFQSHTVDHDISFSVAPFMPSKCVIYRYFQILKDPQYYSPVFIPSANSRVVRAPVSPQTEIDDLICS